MVDSEIRTIGKSVSEVYGTIVEVDMRMPPNNRILKFLEKIKTPNMICRDDYQIELVWNETEQTIQDCIHDLLMRI